MSSHQKNIREIIICGSIVFIGLIVFKLIPMMIWGGDIRFDASAHVAAAIFVLYVIWFFIDQNKRWRLPYIIFSLMVLTIISLQRILVNAHNDIGLLIGLLLGLSGIVGSHWKYFKNRIDF